jgi:hypothetical protein
VQTAGAGVFGDVGGDGLMQSISFGALLCLALMAANADAAPRKAKPKTNQILFGQKWVDKSGIERHARLEVNWEGYFYKGPKLLREPIMDEKRSTVNRGIFPIKYNETGIVTAYLSIDESGKVTNCVIEKRGDYPTLETHFCKHVTVNARFHPALGADGKRVSVNGEFSGAYKTDTQNYMIVTTGPDGEIQKDQRETKPLEAITLETLKLPDIPANARGLTVGIYLFVDIFGKVTECQISQPSFIDVVDAHLCRHTGGTKFAPALDHLGNPKNDLFFSEFVL